VSDSSLYKRLGGVFAIAAVIDHFSDAVVENPIVGQQSENPALREWHTKNLKRLPGLKFMRTLWVCNVSGGPFQFTATHGRLCRGRKARLKLLYCPVQTILHSQSWAGSVAASRRDHRIKLQDEAAVVAELF